MTRLTTRSLRTAEHIRDRKPFTTSGNMYAEGHASDDPLRYVYEGYLRGLDLEALRRDVQAHRIDYIVWSFSTPIAWHRTDGTWHVVAQTFSNTTSKHQGNCYLIPNSGVRTRIVWQGMKGGVNQGYNLYVGAALTQVGHADSKDRAEFLARFIYLNGVPTGTSMDGVTVP